MVFLVRHAKAGHRPADLSNDRLRPLTESGWQQANALAVSLSEAVAVGPLLSSPFLRCMQTLEPLADRLGIPVVADDRLAENKSTKAMLDLMNDLPDGAVMCSHGDMIPDAIQALQRRGCEIVTAPHWKKASVWVLDRDGSGQFVTASAWPPPKE